MKVVKLKDFVSYRTLYWTYIFLIGLVFIFLVPPFQKADEHTHYERAQSLANGQFYCSSTRGFVLNNGDHNLVREMFFFEITQKYNEKFPKSVISLKKNNEVGEIEQGSSACTLNFLGYIPNSFGLFVGKIFNYPLLSFYLSRVCGFLFFMCCFIFSLKIIKNISYKYILYFYGIIPMVLHQATAISYDVVQLSLVPLIFSLFIRLLQPENKNYNKLFFCTILLIFVLVKPGYYPILLLFFLIPNQLKGRNIVKSFLFCLLFFIIFIVNFKFSNLSSVTKTNLQFSLLKQDPFYFLPVLINTTVKKMPFYFESMIGVFGFLDYKLSYFIFNIFYTLFIFVCYFISKKIDKKELVNNKNLFLIFIVFFTIYLLIHLAMYICCTLVAGDLINGVQGRYLLSFVPFLMVFLVSFFKNLNNKFVKILFCFFIFLIILGNSSYSIYMRYYDYSNTFSDSQQVDENIELMSKKDNFDKINIDSKKTFLINVNKDRKIGGFEMICNNENKKIELPYKYIIKDKDCDKKIFSGYFNQSLIQEQGVHKVIFNKIIKLEDNKICLEIEPIGNTPNRDYIKILSSDSKLMLNVLYIKN